MLFTSEYDVFFEGLEKKEGLTYLSFKDEERRLEMNELIHETLMLLITDYCNEKNASLTCDMWFRDLQLVHILGDHCDMITTTALRATIILRKYRDFIEYCMEQILGYKCEIRIYDYKMTTAIYNDSVKSADPAFNRISNFESFPPEAFTDPVKFKEIEERMNFVLECEKFSNAVKKTEVSEEKEISEPLPEITKEKESSGENIEYTDDMPDLTKKGTLIDSYTFENFVEGSSNKFAKAACMAVAKFPTTYNPLFIYGNSGLGKTHLLNAVVHYMNENHPHLKIIYKKCEKFLDELIHALRTGSTAEFKNYYRTCDVLLIDDVQFLAGKEQTQEEFFHTFSTLYEAEKQIILTSDRPPKEIKPLEERLLTRFEGGVLADVQPPNFELRLAIIEKKASDMNLNISTELIEYMAERLQNNIRQIEGLLKRISAVSSLTGSEITKAIIDDAISVIDPGNIPTDTLVERILIAVSKEFGVTEEELKSSRKTDNIANARHVAIYVIKKKTELSLKKIGAIFNRNHATVISSIDKVNNNIRTINNYEAMIERIFKEIGKKE